MTGDPALADIIARAQNRDPDAIDELVRHYEPQLKRIIRFKLTNPRLRRFMDSLDVCQSVLGSFFAQLFDGKLDVSDPKKLRAFLSLVAKHKVIDRARKHDPKRHNVEIAGGDGLAQRAADQLPKPDSVVANRDLVDAVREHLRPENQELLDLWLGGIGWVEISQRVGISAEALRKRLNRDVDRVAHQLGLLEPVE